MMEIQLWQQQDAKLLVVPYGMQTNVELLGKNIQVLNLQLDQPHGL